MNFLGQISPLQFWLFFGFARIRLNTLYPSRTYGIWIFEGSGLFWLGSLTTFSKPQTPEKGFALFCKTISHGF
jgi:hypothetical protein